jgi:Tfp pilus assembly protein PilX
MNKHTTTLAKDQKGVVLITILVIGMIVTFVGLSMADVAIRQYSTTSRSVFETNATLSAEAGIEQTLFELNSDNTFTGFEEEAFTDDQQQGRMTYQTEVSTGEGNERIITSTGRAYRYGQDNVLSERTVRVTIVGTVSSSYAVHTGPGGLILGGSASIRNTDVYVGGTITMSGASAIGTDQQPALVNVAYKSCPTGSNPGPTYPQPCTTGQPISLANNAQKILGTTCAYRQTQSKFPNEAWNTPAQIRPGTGGMVNGVPGGQGLVAGCVPADVTSPTYDRAEHISRVAVTGAASNNTYNCSNWVNPIGFVRTWPANLKLTGNTNVESSCDLTITGDVYITGNLTLGGAAVMKVAESVGDRVPTIIVDGTVDAGGGSRILANSRGTNVRIISFKSTASCSPSCTDVTGTNLKNSQNQSNVTVNGGGIYAGTVFQAYWSKITIGGAGNVGGAIGQTVDMSGAGNVTFGAGLSSGTTTWTIRSYQRLYESVQ